MIAQLQWPDDAVQTHCVGQHFPLGSSKFIQPIQPSKGYKWVWKCIDIYTRKTEPTVTQTWNKTSLVKTNHHHQQNLHRSHNEVCVLFTVQVCEVELINLFMVTIVNGLSLSNGWSNITWYSFLAFQT